VSYREENGQVILTMSRTLAVFWLFTGVALGQVTTASIADPCELVGIEGRIYVLADYYWRMGIELCEKSLPISTRHLPMLPMVEPLPPE
jgi:hypothetical protein